MKEKERCSLITTYSNLFNKIVLMCDWTVNNETSNILIKQSKTMILAIVEHIEIWYVELKLLQLNHVIQS